MGLDSGATTRRHDEDSTARFTRLDDRTAEGMTVLAVYMDDETSSSAPWVVGEDHDRFVRIDGRWRFASGIGRTDD